jgi:simple sugar transport system substrate-binding protein
VDPSITLDRRVLGNWYDANKASDLAKSMIESGVKVIGTICGGANQGVLDAAREAGVYVVMWDSNEYARVPGTVAGSGALAQERLVYEEVSRAMAGELKFGTARVVSLAEGYVEFITDDPNYRDTVPEALRDRQDQVIASIKEGSLKLDVPEF